MKDATAATVAPLFDQETSVVRSAGSIFGSHRWSSSSFSAMVSFCLSIRGILIRQYLSVARQSRRAICQRLMSKSKAVQVAVESKELS